MAESKWQAIMMATVLCFIVGLLMFLNDVHSTGEAPQRFSLTISWSTFSIVGAGLVLVAIAGAVLLYLDQRKNQSQYR